jgi:hypothetical protein
VTKQKTTARFDHAEDGIRFNDRLIDRLGATAQKAPEKFLFLRSDVVADADNPHPIGS